MTVTVASFDRVRGFVLRYGDRQTYCNRFSDNPHLAFRGFEVYLDPAPGPGYMDCDPARADFDEIVIRDQESTPIYHRLRRVEGPTGPVVEPADDPAIEAYVDAMLAIIGRA